MLERERPGYSAWRLEHHLLDNVRQAVLNIGGVKNPEPHPARGKPAPARRDEAAHRRAKAAARRRAAERQRQIDEGLIT